MMAPVSALPIEPAGTTGPAQTPRGGAAAEAEASKEVFLKLLVAQLQNQNPLSPSDPIQFLSQLAQFSALEQMIGMRQELGSIRAAVEGPRDPAPGGSAGNS